MFAFSWGSNWIVTSFFKCSHNFLGVELTSCLSPAFLKGKQKRKKQEKYLVFYYCDHTHARTKVCFYFSSSLHQLAETYKICKIAELFSHVCLCIGTFNSAVPHPYNFQYFFNVFQYFFNCMSILKKFSFM